MREIVTEKRVREDEGMGREEEIVGKGLRGEAYDWTGPILEPTSAAIIPGMRSEMNDAVCACTHMVRSKWPSGASQMHEDRSRGSSII